MPGPIETKVVGGTTGAGVGSIASGFVLWVLGVTIWGVPTAAGQAGAAIAAVPSPVAELIALLITVVATFAGGWLAPHTPRPDLPQEGP